MDKAIITSSVTIVMPVYNASKYLKDSIDSILEQTYRDFIFLIINDGSVDDSEKIILSYSDSRIKYIKNDRNLGLVATLNKGIDLTETEFFARMDADDIAFPKRLQQQISYLISHPEIGVCGTLFEKFGEETGISQLSLSNDEIVGTLLFSNSICHPSVVIRTSLLKENEIRFGVDFTYNDNYGHKLLEFEDYALWHKLKHFTKFTNLNQVLLKYRREGQNLSAQNMGAIMKRRFEFISFWLKELDIQPDVRAINLHCNYNSISNGKIKDDIEILKKHFHSIIAANQIKQIYPQQALKKNINKQWDRFFYFVSDKGFRYAINYWMVSGKVKKKQFFYALKVALRK